MQPNFTVPESMSHLTDERPLVKVVVDVHETMTMLTAGVMEIAPEQMIDDHTVKYIGGLIVDSVASPYPHTKAINSVAAFFPQGVRDKVEKLVDEVKESFSHELHVTEQSTEILLGQKIYPAKDMSTIQSSVGMTVTLAYRLGAEPDDPYIDNPSVGLTQEEIQLAEELEDEVSEEIIHID